MNQQWQDYWLACQQDKATIEAAARQIAAEIQQNGYHLGTEEPCKSASESAPSTS